MAWYDPLVIPWRDLSKQGVSPGQLKADLAAMVLANKGLGDVAQPAADAPLYMAAADGLVYPGSLGPRLSLASGVLSVVHGAGSGLLQDNTAFALRIWNDAGTLKHAIGAYNAPATASSWAGKISGASASYTATPTGADATTAMAAGGKISATNTNRFILNTAQQTTGLMFLDCVLGPTAPVTTAMRCSVIPQSRAVWDDTLSTPAAVTLIRPEIAVWINTGGSTWTTWALNTTNIPAGATLQINCKGYLV